MFPPKRQAAAVTPAATARGGGSHARVYVNRILHSPCAAGWWGAAGGAFCSLGGAAHPPALALRRSELTHVVTDVTTDPTLPRTSSTRCPKVRAALAHADAKRARDGGRFSCPPRRAQCTYHEAVFFQAQANRTDEGMRLYYVCCDPSCHHLWTE